MNLQLLFSFLVFSFAENLFKLKISNPFRKYFHDMVLSVLFEELLSGKKWYTKTICIVFRSQIIESVDFGF